MTALEMMREAEILYESVASQDAPGYETREWSYLLTQAQEQVVLEIIERGADKDDAGRTILSPIIEHFEETLTLVNYEAEITYPTGVDIPLHPGAEEAIYPATTGVHIPIVPKPYDYVVMNRLNPMERPYEELWWRTIVEGTHKIIAHVETGNFDYHLIYYKKPAPIIVEVLTGGETIDGIAAQTNCQLHSSIHRRITARAAILAKAYTPEQIRLQTQAATKELPAI